MLTGIAFLPSFVLCIDTEEALFSPDAIVRDGMHASAFV